MVILNPEFLNKNCLEGDLKCKVWVFLPQDAGSIGWGLKTTPQRLWCKWLLETLLPKPWCGMTSKMTQEIACEPGSLEDKILWKILERLYQRDKRKRKKKSEESYLLWEWRGAESSLKGHWAGGRTAVGVSYLMGQPASTGERHPSLATSLAVGLLKSTSKPIRFPECLKKEVVHCLKVL